MAFVAAALAIGAGTALVGGIGKKIAADNLANKQRNALNNLKESQFISPALLEALGNSQKRKDATMYAGQDIDQANIQRSAGSAFANLSRGTTSSTNLVNGAMAIQGQQNIANQGIQRNLAQFKDRANQDYTQLLLQKGNVQMANRRQYEASKSALQAAIMQNEAQGDNALWNAFSQIGGAAAAAGSAGLFKGSRGLSDANGMGSGSAMPTANQALGSNGWRNGFFQKGNYNPFEE
jgi:hypothetical protein